VSAAGVSAILVMLAFPALAQSESTGGNGDSEALEKSTERGPVSATTRVEPTTVRIGDPITLVLEVTAEAGVELLMPAFGESLERFRILQFVPRERVDDQGRSVATQRYSLQVLASGEHTIPPITIEFVDRRPGKRPAPDGEDAYELLTEGMEFKVDSVVPRGAGDALKPPLGPLAASARGDTELWPWISAAAAGLVVAVAFGWRFLATWRNRTRRRTAYEIAAARLDDLRARPRPDAQAMDSFFVELSDIVRRYLEDRFGLHAQELTTEEFLEVAAASPDLDDDRRRFLRKFLNSADQVKFARHVPEAADVETFLAAVGDFLVRTREQPSSEPDRSESGEKAFA